MIKIGKTYKLKREAVEFLNSHAIQLHQVWGKIPKEGREDFIFDFLSEEIFVTIVSESPSCDNTYLAIMTSDIGMTCHYVSASDVGAEA